MKKILPFVLLMASLACAPGAEQLPKQPAIKNAVPEPAAPAAASPLIPKYWSLESFVGVKTENFDDDGVGYYGLGAQAYFTESVGIGVEALWREQEVRDDTGPLVDQSNLNLLLTRAYSDKLSATWFGGGGREWAHEEWLVNAGVRLDYILWNKGDTEVGVFGSGRWEKELDKRQDHVGLFTAGLSFNF